MNAYEKEHALKKELIIHHLENLLSDDDRNEMFNIIQDALDMSAFEVAWERIYPMYNFDNVMSAYKPSQIADLVLGEDMCNPYFAFGGLYVFNTFTYDEIPKLFPFSTIAEAVLEDNCDWHSQFFSDICSLDVKELRYKVIDTVVKDDLDNVIASFNNFLSEVRGCDEHIFMMDTDLKEIWFDMLGDDDDFMKQMTTLYEAIKSGNFHLTDCYWEMPTEDGHRFGSDIRSFNELYESWNFALLENDYADYLITTRDYEGLSTPVACQLDKLFAEFGI